MEEAQRGREYYLFSKMRGQVQGDDNQDKRACRLQAGISPKQDKKTEIAEGAHCKRTQLLRFQLIYILKITWRGLHDCSGAG